MNRKELKTNIQSYIQENIRNDKLLAELTGAFSKKDLDIKLPSLLFNEEAISIFDGEEESTIEISDIELICLSKALYDYSHNEEVSPYKCFSNMELEQYDQFTIIDDTKTDTAVFKECIKIDERNYLCYNTAMDYVNLRNNKLVAYFEGFQRKSKITKLKNGMSIKKISVNKKALKVLKKRFEKQDILPTAIAFSVLKYEGKRVNVKSEHIEGTSNIYNLYIKPDFNKTSETYTPLIITDGNHRFTSICNAQESSLEKGIELARKSGLGLMIHISTEQETKQYIKDVFQRSDTDMNFIDNLVDDTDIGKFTDIFIAKSKILNRNVEYSFSDCKATHAITYLKPIKQGVERTDMILSDEIERAFKAETMAKCIDLLITYIKNKYYEGKLEKMQKTDLLSFNSIIGYIAIANTLIKKDGYITSIKTIGKKLYELNSSNYFTNLNLNKANYNLNDIYTTFEEVVKNV